MSAPARLHAQLLEMLALYAAGASWAPGAVVYEEGATARGMYIVVHGLVVLRTRAADGRFFSPWLASAGCTFGTEGLEPGSSYRSAAYAERASETLHLSAERFEQLLRERSPLGLALVGRIGAERGAALAQFVEHAMLPVQQRLVAALLRLARTGQTDEEQARSSLRVSRRLLREMVGATRESISVALRQLAARGAIRLDGTDTVVIGDSRRIAAILTSEAITRDDGTANIRSEIAPSPL